MAWPQVLEQERAELKRTDLNASRKARLYLSSLTLTDALVLADFTAAEATFDGYAAQDLSFPNAAVIESTVRAYMDSDPLTFSPSGSGGGQTIGGVYITDDSGSPTELIEVYPFASGYLTVNSTPFTVVLRDGTRSQTRCV
jgi:hypothetical protein